MEISVDCVIPEIKSCTTLFIQQNIFGGYWKVIKMLCPTVCLQSGFNLKFSGFKICMANYGISFPVVLIFLFRVRVSL